MDSAVLALAFSELPACLASGSESGKIAVWNVQGGPPVPLSPHAVGLVGLFLIGWVAAAECQFGHDPAV
jgi:WD40 repeat protein